MDVKESAITFYQEARAAERVLVLDLGFLGDAVHLIPALRRIREAMPRAHLEVIISEHIKDVLRLVPWVDTVRGYPRFPKSPGLFWHVPFIRELRAERWPVVVNLNGSDRSSILSWFSGAPLRLGRVPPKVPAFWKRCFTHQVAVPYAGPVFRQRWECLSQAGFPGQSPVFAAEVPEDVRRTTKELTGGLRGYVHLSPFTTQDSKELPLPVLARIIDGWSTAHPEMPLAVSCAPNVRERGKLADLLAALRGPKPWRVFDGNLSLLELAGVIARSRLHLGGDSGALHLAFMLGVPTISWWRDYAGREEWMPEGPEHRALIGRESPGGLLGINAEALLAAEAL